MPRRKADEHEIRKRREQIIRGARRCLARFGFHATSVQHLERECGLTRGTLFKYFDSKADRLTAVVAAEEARREAQFRAVAQRQDQMDSLAAAVNASTAPITAAAIRSTANGLIPTRSPIQSGSAPEPTILLAPHSPETPKHPETWRLGPMKGPKSPRL